LLGLQHFFGERTGVVDQVQRYNRVAMTLHWLIAFLIIGMLLMGLVMGDLPSGPLKGQVYQLHKSIGITILLLSLARLGWRLLNPPPALASPMAIWEKTLLHSVHWGFYALIILMPLSGWAMSTAFAPDRPIVLYGLLAWPNFPVLPAVSEAEPKALAKQLSEVHELLGNLIWALLALHVGAALKHHFWKRDEVLLRMTPRWLAGSLHCARNKFSCKKPEKSPIA
jgi:cytochrome b561